MWHGLPVPHTSPAQNQGPSKQPASGGLGTRPSTRHGRSGAWSRGLTKRRLRQHSNAWGAHSHYWVVQRKNQVCLSRVALPAGKQQADEGPGRQVSAG